jgi:mannan endo-1,4-beta-mannosidase
MKKTILPLMGILCLLNLAHAEPIDDAVQGTGPNQHNYVGAGWVHATSIPAFYNNTLSYSSATGAYVTLTFVGNKVEWYTEKKKTHGIAAVSIDGGAETMIDLYSSTEQHLFVTPVRL